MDAIRIVPGGEYDGAGRSRGLARGHLVYAGDRNLTGEGMGIGGVAVKDATGTYFSRSGSGRADGLGRTYTLDTRMTWCVNGRPSPRLTRWVGSAVEAYMRRPGLQPLLLRPVPRLQRALRADPGLETVPPAGRVTVACTVEGGRVEVRAVVRPPLRPGSTVCLLNELSAEWFAAGVRGGEVGPPPPGWEAIDSRDPPQLFDPVHGLRFAIAGPSVSPPVPARLFWGRERTGDLCWAGFCLEIGPLDGLQEPLEARYSISLSGDGCP